MSRRDKRGRDAVSRRLTERLSQICMKTQTANLVCGLERKKRAQRKRDSDRTKKLMRNKCASFETPLFEVEAGCEELGKKLGKSGISVLGISDINFAKAIINLINK